MQNGWTKEESVRRQILYVNYYAGYKRERKKEREFKQLDRAFWQKNGPSALRTPELDRAYSAIIDGEHDAKIRAIHYKELIDGIVSKTSIPSKEFWFWEATRDKRHRKGLRTRENKKYKKKKCT